jgi:hypothetical protein
MACRPSPHCSRFCLSPGFQPRLLRLCCHLETGGRQARSPDQCFNPTFRRTLIVIGLPLLCGHCETFTGHVSKPFSLDDSLQHPTGSRMVAVVPMLERFGGNPSASPRGGGSHTLPDPSCHPQEYRCLAPSPRLLLRACPVDVVIAAYLIFEFVSSSNGFCTVTEPHR